ncbi:MMPL family transporter [Thiohalophilus sp.]|uniref:MMPL family transporter n=1 Tax=Thiohalophilus sp. TaxID=3028392 RepID=UPI002ACD6B48|nr:MMPL family transporter [Thiohalophilus sp.]MDZ7805007.1 MMPL family transporter [Thiohalophilus sp.]
MNKIKPLTLHAVWLLATVLLSIYLVFNLHTVTDLKQFMPSGKEDGTFHELQSELLSGRESSAMFVIISGASSEELIRLSRVLRAEFSVTADNVILQNGQEGFDDSQLEVLEEKRFLLVDTDWSLAGLKNAFRHRISDLRQGQGPLIGDLIKSDPYLSIKTYFQPLERQSKLNKQYPVWYAPEVGAILRVDFRNPDVGLDTIEQIQRELQSTFRKLSPAGNARLEMTGPGAIAVATRNEIKMVTQRLSWAIPLLLVLVFWLAYRSVYLVWYSGIPLVTGALVALAITQIVFNSVHGVVIAFGITMLGVALDYPVHLFSHKYPGEKLCVTANRIWPILRLGGLSSAGAFLILLFSGFEGLSQLAIYASTGLIIALLITRYFLPEIVNPEKVNPRLFKSLPKVFTPYAIVVLILVIMAVSLPWVQRDIYWSDSVDAISPVSDEVKKQDAKLRNVIGGVEVSDVFVIADSDLQRVLVSTEQLTEKLQDLVSKGIVNYVVPVTDFLPSAKRQKARKNSIPESDELQNNLRSAVENMPFKPSAFQSFIELSQNTKRQNPASYDEILGTPAGPFVRQGLVQTHDGWLSVIRVSGLSSPKRFMQWLEENPGVRQYHVNIKDQVSNLFEEYRDRTLSAVYLVLVFLTVVVFLYSRQFMNSLRVITPVFIGVAGGLAAGLLGGPGLNIFHLMAIFLVIGMGLDYSLFFNHSRGKADVFARSFHAVGVSVITTVTLFMFLAFSSIPVLSAMGSVIVAGIFLSFLTSWLISSID